ncbi:hypothetical protein [Acidovorax sp.]|uniref:hypothetical protein n=1 Tax=Acidovorax sp. TaxID=1872122 RepID=UPI00391BD7A1
MTLLPFTHRLLSVLALAVAASAAHAQSYCERQAFDPELPVGLDGKYEVVGKAARTGKPYAGRLSVALGKDSYILRRTVGGRQVRGEGWIELCSPDRFMVLRVQYQTPRPEAGTFICYLRTGGDFDYRVSCTDFDGKALEAWFQRP